MHTCLPVRTSLPARCTAIARLIRPQDVSAHAQQGLRHGHTCHRNNQVEGIACYLLGLQLRYIADPKRRDYWCPPLATLERGGGDCDDFSILAASLLRAAGIRAEVVLGWWRQRGGRGYHAWVAGMLSCGCRFALEPQTGEVWWNGTPPAYDAEFLIGPEACQRVNRDLAVTNAI